MPVNILMPALSPTMEKGNLARWLKKEGDEVKVGDVIAEIETDKATMEYEAIDDGVLAKIVVAEGTQDVPVNSLIAVIASEGEEVKATAAAAGKGAPPAKAQAPVPPSPPPSPPRGEGVTPPSPPKATAPSQTTVSPQASIAPQAAAAPSSQRGEGGGEGAGVSHSGNRIFSSPLARRLAKDAGLDIARISGTGPHGRVVASDVEAAKSGKGLAPAAPARPAAAPAITPAMADSQVLALYEPGSYELIPHDGMRRTIAQRLTASTQNVPHFYLTMDCDIGKLLAAREEINALTPKDKDGKPAYKLSVNDFVIKALALALQRIPDANVSWTDGAMLKHKHSDVGVAVALPGGLITPIIRMAETKSLSAISNEMRDLAARARGRKLKPNEYQGGTTSVSNLGMYGIKDFTAVINPPQSTILAVGVGEERPVVRNGKIEAAHIMSVTLSCDHRAVDGALGAELLGAFKTLIENPVIMVV
ncbi:MAG: pyruvate dehydrogenase complex dihydrolipoamide acetyltransferase [Xanthobacteraceae bacterium]